MDKQRVSDTISVTTDGRSIVDPKKLLAKDHIRTAIREMQQKIAIASSKSPLKPKA